MEDRRTIHIKCQQGASPPVYAFEEINGNATLKEEEKRAHQVCSLMHNGASVKSTILPSLNRGEVNPLDAGPIIPR